MRWKVAGEHMHLSTQIVLLTGSDMQTRFKYDKAAHVEQIYTTS